MYTHRRRLRRCVAYSCQAREASNYLDSTSSVEVNIDTECPGAWTVFFAVFVCAASVDGSAKLKVFDTSIQGCREVILQPSSIFVLLSFRGLPFRGFFWVCFFFLSRMPLQANACPAGSHDLTQMTKKQKAKQVFMASGD